nr:MAG TPA: hypothetical protein [Caudoviricetes sp.]
MGVFLCTGREGPIQGDLLRPCPNHPGGQIQCFCYLGYPPPCLFRATVLPGIDEPPRHLNIDPGLSFGRLRSDIPTYRVL